MRPQSSSYMIILLLVSVVVVSGCTDSTANSEQDTEEYSTTLYNGTSGNMTMRLMVNNNTETYDVTIKHTSRNMNGNGFISRYDNVEDTASLLCGAAQQFTYNYSEISDETDRTLSEALANTGDSKDSELPQWTFEDFEPDTVRYTLTDVATSRQLASCEPTEQELNIRINVEKDEEAEGSISENSEGLS